jgi:mycoredoxin
MTERPLTRVYGREACVDTQLARRVLDERGVNYEWHDVEAAPQKHEEATNLNGGSPKLPTVVLPNGSVLVEPSEEQLVAALGEDARDDRPRDTT